jgi:NAD(P)-dependent dehydrogenase (short-subunit alcohol dehydrogenase family)
MDMPVDFSHLPQPVMPRVPPQKMLLGQKALVTGASSGIGRAIAMSLADAGADVVINYVSGMDKAVELANELKARGTRAIAIKADVGDEMQVQAMFKQAIAEFGTLDILVNNAGLQQDAPFHELSLAQWNRVINVNLTGQFLCAREAVREFMRRGVKPDVSCARSDSVGGARQLRRIQGRRDADDEEHRSRGGAAAHPREFDLPGRDSHADQHGSVGHARALQRAHEAHSVQAHR